MKDKMNRSSMAYNYCAKIILFTDHPKYILIKMPFSYKNRLLHTDKISILNSCHFANLPYILQKHIEPKKSIEICL